MLSAWAAHFQKLRYGGEIRSYDVYQNWNDISSAVSIDGFTYYADGTNQNKEIQIVGAALTGTTLANTGVYSKNVLGVYTIQNFWTYTGKVSKAVITIDTSDRFSGQTDTWERKTIMHELGHALALDHPSCTDPAIMHQSDSDYVSSSIQSHDEDCLIEKWGE